MFYHRSCDLVGKLPQTSKGNVYIMIMIEHFSKWVELVTLPDKSSHSMSQAFLQQVLNRFRLVLNALLIKDQNSEENSKTYLTMLLLTIIGLQEIILKLMASERGWFRHAKKDFGRFASLGTKRIGTWPYFTSPWVTGCLNTPFCLISFLTFYFLGDIPFHPLPLLLKWIRLWTWTPQPLKLGSSQRGLLYLRGLCPWPWGTCPLHNIETPYGMHTHKVAVIMYL
jgi:hypothetical protein